MLTAKLFFAMGSVREQEKNRKRGKRKRKRKNLNLERGAQPGRIADVEACEHESPLRIWCVCVCLCVCVF
jgi:hypothetical protein